MPRPPRTDDFREQEAYGRQQDIAASALNSKVISVNSAISVADSTVDSIGLVASVADSKAISGAFAGNFVDGVVSTGKITGLAVTRGAHYYNAAGIDLGSGTEEFEIGTVTVFLNESIDWVTLWCSIQIVQTLMVFTKEGWFARSIDFKLKRDNINGAIIAAAESVGYWETTPVILIGIDVPGVTGNRTYKLTGAHSVDPTFDSFRGIIGFRKMMALAISR